MQNVQLLVFPLVNVSFLPPHAHLPVYMIWIMRSTTTTATG